MRGRDHEAQIRVKRVQIGPDRLLADPIAPVAVQQQRHAPVFPENPLLVENRHGNGRGQRRCGRVFPRDAHVRVDRGVQSRRAVLGVLHVDSFGCVEVRIVVGHFLRFDHLQFLRGRAETNIVVPNGGRGGGVERDGDQVLVVVGGVGKRSVVGGVVRIDVWEEDLFGGGGGVCGGEVVGIHEKRRLPGQGREVAGGGICVRVDREK